MEPILMAQIEPPQNIEGGDFYYRSYAPGVCMAQEEGVYVVNLTSEHRLREEIAGQADILILKNICDPDYFPVISKRRSQKRPTIYEIADDLLAIPPWNPVYFFYKHQENRILFQQLAQSCDGLQFTCKRLQDIYGHLQPNNTVFNNQVLEFPPARKKSPDSSYRVVIGWGGSHGHLEDLKEVAGPLLSWIERNPNASLHLMCSEEIWNLFEKLPRHRKKRTIPGSVGKYYDFLSGIDIGLIPLKDTAFNRSRSDIKFLEYAAAGVVSVARRLDPYLETIVHGETGLFFNSPDEMIYSLDRLIGDNGLIERVSGAARQYALVERRQTGHVQERLFYYRETTKNIGPTGDLLKNFENLYARWSACEGAKAQGRYLKLGPGKFEKLLHDGLVTMQISKEILKAKKMFARAAELEPANYLPHLFGTPVSANPVQSLSRALEMKPDSLKAWIMLGDQLKNSGKIVEALETYETATQIFPEYTEPIIRAAELLKRVGHNAGADRLIHQVKQMTANLISNS
jgi:glycosyltransferase involved in cell wall biosynthesis